jgi:hypothetical protein
VQFRLKALGLHLISSAIALGLILGTLYFCWYRWPGWYLADAAKVIGVMAGVDVVLGPLLTFVIAAPSKRRAELARDIGVIVVIQLIALGYGTTSLWNGRPLYYAFSETVLQLVQAYDISPEEALWGRQQNPTLAAHWYSLPRWVWAPLPEDSVESQKIVGSAVSGGTDIVGMPRYFKPWEAGLTQLKTKLKKLDEVGYFMPKQKLRLKAEMQAAGFSPDQPNAIPFTGRGMPLLAVFDANAKLVGIFEAR